MKGGPLAGQSEAFFLSIAPDLRVREKECGGAGRFVSLGSLFGKSKRIALFDQVGAGKRTAARREFRRLLLPSTAEPEDLPCWLSRVGERTTEVDLHKLIWSEAFDSPPLRIRLRLAAVAQVVA